MTTIRSHIEPVSNKAYGLWKPVAKVNIFVLKSHNKLKLMLVKNEKNLVKKKKKSRHFS